MSKSLLAFCALVVSSFQAWDSHALDAEPFVRALVLIGVLLPASAIVATRDVRVRGAAVLAAAVLMIAARALSAFHLPELALAAFFPGALVLLDHFRDLAARRETPLVDPPHKG
jgi:hypothetical protein